MKLEYNIDSNYRYNIKKPNGGILHTNIILLGKTIYNMKKGFSPIILICGSQRMGKSFVGVWLSYRISTFFHPEKEFSPEKYTFYDPLKTIDLLENFRHEPLLIDEAGAIANKTEWYEKVTIALDKIIQTQAYLSNIYIFVSPFGSDIAKTFRKHFDYILFVRMRGVITIKKIPKKYDDLTDKVPRPYRIEQIKLKKNCIPINVWEKYEKFSIKQKQILREKALQQAKSKKHRNREKFWLD